MVIGLALAGLAAGPESPPPALVVRPIRPDGQLEQLLALFEGAKAPHPAAALSAWRRATGRHDGLSKAAQAGVAALNPEMIAELRTLDSAEMDFWLEGDQVRWCSLMPRDDGTLAAVATALALTDGQAEPPLDGAAVDRLGPPGAPLMARTPKGGVALAGDLATLALALDRMGRPAEFDAPAGQSGWWLSLVPERVGPDAPGWARQVAAALTGLGCRQARALARIDGDSLVVDLATTHPPATSGGPSLDPRWLEVIPSENVVAAVAAAVDPASLDRIFRAAEGVEKADPARAGAGPLRARLGLAARAAGATIERDLWPNLQGWTAWATADAAGRIDGAGLVLHARDTWAAERILSRVAEPICARLAARVALSRQRDDTTVQIAWGLAAPGGGAHGSAATALRAGWTEAPPGRAGGFWPHRLAPRLTNEPTAAALREAPPMVWYGSEGVEAGHDTIRWTGLAGMVRRYLDRLPMRFEPE